MNMVKNSAFFYQIRILFKILNEIHFLLKTLAWTLLSGL